MDSIKRYKKYKSMEFDKILMLIKYDTIKCGRYAHHVKIDKKSIKIDRKELFGDGNREDIDQGE